MSDQRDKGETVGADLTALRESIADAASTSGALWVTYLSVFFYFLISVGSVTHKDLFLNSHMKLPLLNADLPLTGFFLLGPISFVIMHAYVLLHFVMLTDRIRAFNQAVARVDDPDAHRLRLPTNFFVQFLAGPSTEIQALEMSLWAIAVITLAIGPVLLLIFIELQFLPYHDPLISWSHRALVTIDLALLWIYWPRRRLTGGDAIRRSHAPLTLWTRRILYTFTPVALIFVWLIATFPGEFLHWPNVPMDPRGWIIEGEIDPGSLRPSSPFTNRLALPKFNVADAAHADEPVASEDAPPSPVTPVAKNSTSLVVEGRDLRWAIFKLADLRGSDLIHNDLSGAQLGSADLRAAKLRNATLVGASFDFAKLQRTDFAYADLERANLMHARMSNTDLTCANLTGAVLSGADLTGATLTNANLTDAVLKGTLVGQDHLHGACGIPKELPAGLQVEACPSTNEMAKACGGAAWIR